MSKYMKPSTDTIRKVTNGFGSMPARQMIEIRQRAMKIIMMDYASWCLQQHMSVADTKKAVMETIDEAISSGISTPKLKETLEKFIDKKSRTVDPIMKLHCAITMETLETTGGAGEPDPTTLPKDVQEAAECGPDCFGGERPSLESLALRTTDCQMRLYSAVGGSIADKIFRTLGTHIDPKYVSAR